MDLELIPGSKSCSKKQKIDLIYTQSGNKCVYKFGLIK